MHDRPEAAILGDASRALRAGDASASLAIVQEHARAYAHGELAEEREALRIRALAALGRVIEARLHAERFHETFPDSVHRRVVDDALARTKESP
jgi:hypothetical protein